MKIAVCISGEPRTFQHTHESLKAYLRGHEVDYFLHTWATDAATEAALTAAYRPVNAVFEAKPDFTPCSREVLATFGHHDFSFIWMADMCHGIGEVMRLKAQQEAVMGRKYDLVVRTRYDLLMGGVLNPTILDPAMVNTPNTGNCKNGYNDRIAFGPSDLMDRYGNLRYWLPKSINPAFYDHGEPGYHPEPVLRHYLDKVALVPVRLVPIEAKLLRPQFAGMPYGRVREDLRNHHFGHKVPKWNETLRSLGLLS